MTESECKDALLKSPIFRDLPAENLDAIARAARSEAAPAGSVIFREGDHGDCFYIVCSGNVRAYITNEKGNEIDLALRGPGDSFGEMALLTGEPRAASVQALEETRLMVLSRDQFDRILADNPGISKSFMKEMRTWLIKDQEMIEMEAEQIYKASQLSWHHLVLIVGISIVLALSFNHSNPNGIPLFPAIFDRGSVPAIGAAAAMAESKQQEVLIIDAMPANFFQERHIAGAVNMPMALFDIVYLMTFTEEQKDRKIIVYGSTISRPYDLEIAGKLVLRGYTDVKIMEGGLPAWEEKGYPVEGKPKK